MLLLIPVLGQESGNLTIHVVQRGDTLFQIAQQYGLSIEAIARANGIASPGNIQIGQRLIIPVTTQSDLQLNRIHTVQPGETLSAIAQLYGLSVEQLAAWNDLLNPNALFVGQTIRLMSETVSGDQFEPIEASIPEVSVPFGPGGGSSPSRAGEQPIEGPLSLIHTVLPGETLYWIGQTYGVAVSDIIRANSISDPSLIYAGQQLEIPGVRAPQLVAELPSPFVSAQILPLAFIEGRTGLFRIVTSAPASLSGTFLDQDLNFASETGGTSHTALVGVPLGTAAGVYPARIIALEPSGATVTLDANIRVASGGYGVEQFTLLADRSNLLDPGIDEAELTLLRSVTARYTPNRWFGGQFGLPAAATITSPFGVVRSYDNGAILRAHLGTDFAGVPGTPILAAAAGTVVLADTLNVRGVSTVIDHGWGIYSGYYHQTERYVGIGATVAEGQVIGTIGSSGRVSGPHLHWEVWVAGVPVDPMQWVLFDFTR